MAINSLSDVLRRKREELFIEGYFVEAADDVTAGVDSTDETIHLLGKPSPLVGVSVDNGNVSVTILRENAAGQNLVQVITDNDPSATDLSGAKRIAWDAVVARNLWINTTNHARTMYLGGTFYPQWIPSITGPAGAPNDRGRRTFAGKSSIPVEITGAGVSIQCRLVLSGNQHAIPGDAKSGNSIFVNSGTGLIAVPGKGTTTAPVYALGITTIASGSATSWTWDFIDGDSVTASMILATGRLEWSAIAAASDVVPSHAMVYYIFSGTGIYPASGFSPSKLSRTGQSYP